MRSVSAVSSPMPIGRLSIAKGRNPYFLGYAVAPSVLFNRLQNTSAYLKNRNINILSLGLNGEVGFGNFLGGTQYLRARSNYNTNFDGEPESWSVTGEWRPIMALKDEFLPSIASPNTLRAFSDGR